MQVLYTRCVGLDVHKDTVVACVCCVSPPMHQEVRSFGTTTTELRAQARDLVSDRNSPCQTSRHVNDYYSYHVRRIGRDRNAGFEPGVPGRL
jgi:hypothetical protein